MAGLIKGITIEFGADTTKLNGALKKTQGALNKTQSELKQVNRALKFNPSNTTLLKQKFDLLKQSVDQTEDKLKQLRQMQKQMNAAGIDKNSAQYRELQREIIKTEDKLKSAEGELRQFGSVGKQQALAVGNAFKSAGNKIKSAGRTITTSVSVYGMAGIYAGGKLIEMSEKQTQAENKLIEIYKTRMGATKGAAKETMNLASALQQQGVVGDEVALSFAQQMATYSSAPSTVNKLMPAFENLLVQQKGLNGTQEDAVGLANMFGKAMMGQTGALKKAGISFTEEQENVLKYGTEEEKAAMMAEVITQNVGEMNKKFAETDAGKIQQAKNAIGDMGEQIGATLLPAVADLVSWFQVHLLPVIQNIINWFQQHPKVATFALALAAITAAIGPLVFVAGSLITMFASIATAAATTGVALLPIVGTVAAIVAGIAACIAIGVLLYKNWDTIKAKAAEIWKNVQKAVQVVTTRVKANFTTMKNTVVNAWTTLKTRVVSIVNTVKTTVSSAFTTLKTKVSTVWNGIKNAITKPIKDAKEKVSDAVDKIKSFFPISVGKIIKNIIKPHIPSIGISWKNAKKGIFSVSYPSIHWNKKAMQNPFMFSGATLFGAGEAGDEILYGRNALMRDMVKAVGVAMGGGSGQTIINVYGSDGMSVNELAAAVEQRIITMQKRKTQAWA